MTNLEYLDFTFPVSGEISHKILELPHLRLISYLDSCQNKNLYDLAIEIRNAMLKKEVVNIADYADASWDCMLMGDFEGAVLTGEFYKNHGGDHIGGLSNLAMGYLWSGQYDKALEIYGKYKNEPEYRMKGILGKEIFLKDINDILRDGHVPPENLELIEKMNHFLIFD